MIVDHITVRETVALDDASGIKRTRDGYMVAEPRVARTGIQVYGGREVGRPDMDRVRVYRPADEVFHKDSMASIAHRPVTNGHPSEPITADNWRKHAVGAVDGTVARDGEFIRVPMIVMDATTIKDVEDGKKELSLGYSADLVWQEGTTGDGQAYDAMQTNIRVNHLAIVDAARGGPKLRIGDTEVETKTGETVEDKEEDAMSDAPKLKQIVVDGLSVDVTDNAAQVVTRYIDRLQADAKAAQDATAKAQAELKDAREAAEKAANAHKTALDAKDAENAALKKNVEDEKAKSAPVALDALVKDRQETAEKAKVMIGDKLVVEGKTSADIRRQVVDAKLGEVAKGWSDDQVATAFITFTADVKPGDKHTAADQINRSFGQPLKDTRSTAKQKYDSDLGNAWKTAGAAA